MRAYERFLNYVGHGTTSDPDAEESPSSPGQLQFARALAREMKQLGIQDAQVDEAGIARGSLPAAPGCETWPAIGFLAHLDTSPDAAGQNVRPVVHPVYAGGDVQLPSGHRISADRYPGLQNFIGQTLITADGTTLLGADDKAGIAEIMTLCERLLCDGLPHGRICVAFTPDEEIGGGARGLDLEDFDAAYAYTVDGGPVGEIEYETFNAARAEIAFTGVNVHPGAAKGIMVNALGMAMDFHRRLPAGETPEETEDRQGFYHLLSLTGDVGAARAEYLLRDHDKALFAAKKDTVRAAAQAVADTFPGGGVELTLEDSYYNMAEVIDQHFFIVEKARSAIRAAGLEPVTKPVRGGTDGSQLSFRGLPCPNLGTGGLYFHGPSECISVEAMDKCVEVLVNIATMGDG